MRGRRVGLFVAPALLLIAGGLAIGWMLDAPQVAAPAAAAGGAAAAAPAQPASPPATGVAPPPAQASAAPSIATSGSTGAATSSGAGAASNGVTPGGVATPARPSTVDLISMEYGGRVERTSSELGDGYGAASRTIDGDPESAWIGTARWPAEIVYSFFGQQPALVAAVTFTPGKRPGPKLARDIEIHASSESATSGFRRIATVTLDPKGETQTFAIPPTEMRFLEIAVLSNDGAPDHVTIGKVGAIEGNAPGYQPLLARNPQLAALVSGGVPDRWAAATRSTAAQELAPMEAARCEPQKPAAPAPAAHAGSKEVLVIGNKTGYPPLWYARNERTRTAPSPYQQINFTTITARDAHAALLADERGYDTVVLSQLCNTKSLTEAFKRQLVAWVAAGHKLLIHDADLCADAIKPDYSFLPFRFGTNNPGARGARGTRLNFVEEGALVNADPRDAGYLDVRQWLAQVNELGDSNTIYEWDPHWCGVLIGRNSAGVNGFHEAYAHFGRGLIVYDGFDKDQGSLSGYHQVVTRELLLPFDPDPLRCSVRVGEFIVTTEERAKTQFMAPGRTYMYPLTIIANNKYQGTVKLTATASPGDVNVSVTPDTVNVTDLSNSVLTAAASPGARGPHVVTVKGTDSTGRTNVLCLNLVERTTGGLRVTTELKHDSKTRKNLEIILDLSGSMKQPLGRSTRIATARQVLRDVLAKVPDDFKVGLRVYGDRFGSRDRQTCTDSHLAVPIRKLDRQRIQSVVDHMQPRGETPLVYSVLQTINDLKSVGGGSVILITDGEESCGGDTARAAAQLRASGLDVSLDIVGFTLKGQQMQRTLMSMAEATGGHFYGAQNGEALSNALMLATIERLPFTVYDATGAQVLTGEVGGPAVELPPGRYKVVVKAGEQDVVADPVTIATAGDAGLRLSFDGGRFVLSR